MSKVEDGEMLAEPGGETYIMVGGATTGLGVVLAVVDGGVGGNEVSGGSSWWCTVNEAIVKVAASCIPDACLWYASMLHS